MVWFLFYGIKMIFIGQYDDVIKYNKIGVVL